MIGQRSFWHAMLRCISAQLLLALVVQGSFSEVKLAMATMTSGELATEWLSRVEMAFAPIKVMNCAASSDFRRLSSWEFLSSAHRSALLISSGRRPHAVLENDIPSVISGFSSKLTANSDDGRAS
jgi:hypothetical protein